MIEVPIVYEGDSLKLVENYNRTRSLHDGSYWEHDSVNEIRTLIKSHYLTVQGYKCSYCEREINTAHGRAWDVEHVIPRSTHPIFLFFPKNLAVSCIDCNQAKFESNVLLRDRKRDYPTDGLLFKIVHPHFDQYSDHIGVLLGRFFFPKTKKGQETISICGLTRFAYQYADWDVGILDNVSLMAKFTELQSSANVDERRVLLLEILAIAQVTLSKSLL